MELIVNRGEGNKIFLYNGELGKQVWEPEPITRFRFKNPIENKWIRNQLTTNKPTAGIIFEGKSYIGTNDGVIYTSDKKIQRIPDITVDPEIFLDEYSYEHDSDRETFERFIGKKGEALNSLKRPQRDRVLDIDRQYNEIKTQERILDRYLTGRLGIRGFAVSKQRQDSEEFLYDGHLLGITETISGNQVNNLAPNALHQINPSLAGFIPSGYPSIGQERFEIKKGLERRIKTSCIDYRSLWDLEGQARIVRDICPRDGSGYAPAKFATDRNIIAISHGNHPSYFLDIKEFQEGKVSDISSTNLDPQKLPTKLLIRDGEVFGDAGNKMWNYSKKEPLDQPIQGQITSLSDSGAYTIKEGNKTYVLDLSDSRKVETLVGDFVFLEKTPQ